MSEDYYTMSYTRPWPCHVMRLTPAKYNVNVILGCRGRALYPPNRMGHCVFFATVIFKMLHFLAEGVKRLTVTACPPQGYHDNVIVIMMILWYNIMHARALVIGT